MCVSSKINFTNNLSKNIKYIETLNTMNKTYYWKSLKRNGHRALKDFISRINSSNNNNNNNNNNNDK